MVPAYTSGFTSFELVAQGTCCLTAPGLSSANRIAVVGVEDLSKSVTSLTVAKPVLEAPDCPAGQFEVVTKVRQQNEMIPSSFTAFHIAVL